MQSVTQKQCVQWV
ncbi:UNVERIFIED_CONTAM: hypothetical protein GTU68_010194 [Idotea baltica]|nr:hypothetical protein [Idotea baltica]